MGSSRAADALVPREFESVTGLRTYNLAIDGAKTAEWQILARELFAERRPRLVVLGVNAGEFQANYLPKQAAMFLFGFRDLIDSFLREGPSGDILERFVRARIGAGWTLFNRRYELKSYCQERLAGLLPKHAQWAREQRQRLARPIPTDGYRHPWMDGRRHGTLQWMIDTGRCQPKNYKQTVPYAASASCFGRFDALLDGLRRRDVEVVVAYLPNSPMTELRWRAVEPKIVTRIERVCQAHGVPFVDTRAVPMPRRNRDFRNELHVGVPLARAISRYVAERLVSDGVIDRGSGRVARNERRRVVLP